MQYTNVKFTTSDTIWQKVYDASSGKARLNVHSFCSCPVRIEGGGYNGIWLETQPMGLFDINWDHPSHIHGKGVQRYGAAAHSSSLITSTSPSSTTSNRSVS